MGGLTANEHDTHRHQFAGSIGFEAQKNCSTRAHLPCAYMVRPRSGVKMLKANSSGQIHANCRMPSPVGHLALHKFPVSLGIGWILPPVPPDIAQPARRGNIYTPLAPVALGDQVLSGAPERAGCFRAQTQWS